MHLLKFLVGFFPQTHQRCICPVSVRDAGNVDADQGTKSVAMFRVKCPMTSSDILEPCWDI